MKVNIKEHEIELQYGMRMYIKYENRTGKSVTFEGLNSYSAISELLYCAISSTLETKKYRDLNILFSYEDFLDWADEQNTTLLMTQFNQWLSSIIKNEVESMKPIKEEPTEEQKEKSKN